MTAAALAALAAAVVALAVRQHHLERELLEQTWLFSGHLVAHESIPL